MTLKNTIIFAMLLLSPILLLIGCTGEQAAPEPENSLSETAEFGNIAAASGKVMPSHWANLGLESGGRVIWIIEEGAEVSKGDVLARLDTTDLEAAMAQSKAAYDSAVAQLEKARAGATVQEIAAAEGAVLAAQGTVAAAEARLAQAKDRAGLSVEASEADLAQAEGKVQAARAELSRAQAELERLKAGAQPEEIAMYQALLNQAQSDFLFFENLHFDQFISKDIGGGPEERARYQRESARGARDAAQARLNLAQSGPTPDELAAATAGVRAMQAQVTIAEAGVAAAEVALAEARASENEIAAAQAQLQIAKGQLAQAESERDRLVAGATIEELAVLEAQVAQAEAVLDEAEMALSKTSLRAPFSGTIGAVYAKEGEVIAPATFAPETVLILGDTHSLQVETSDLNEVDAARVTLGSPVTLTFDALPGTAIEGTISFLSPMAAEGQGGTNFKAIVKMEEPPETLRWGMTAFVDVELD